jgi:hypothetical protein
MTTPAAPSLTSPPTPPSRSDPSSFATRGDAFLTWFPTAWTQLAAAMQWITARTNEVFANSEAATQAASIASAAANSPAVLSASSNASAAALAASSAQIYASQAQATNPDSPIRINPARISANFTLAPGYNGSSAGPISIDDGVSVVVGDGATWSVH